MHEPCKSDAQQIKGDHRRRIDSHVEDVSGGREDRRDHEEDEHSAADVLEQKLGVDNSHHRGKADHDGQFEDDTQTENDGQEEIRIFGDRDRWLESRSTLLNEKVQRHRKNNAIAEISAAQEKTDGQKKKRKNEALFVPIKSWRDKHPNLVEQKRTGDEDPGDQ